MISRLTAHTSKVSFLYSLIKQWYIKVSLAVVQFCDVAILLQFFFLAALSHSSLDVGQKRTLCALLTASLQYLFSPVQN